MRALNGLPTVAARFMQNVRQSRHKPIYLSNLAHNPQSCGLYRGMNDINPFSPPASESRTNAARSDRGLVPHFNVTTLAQRISNPATITTSFVAVLGSLSLYAIVDSVLSVAFIFPFSLGPLAITGLFGFVLVSRIPQWILASSSICYGAWFAFMYVACVTSSSSTGSLGFLVIGLYSLPVLLVFWIAAWATHLKSASNHQQ